jgi:putative inorganic carbon (HCO3(-)) transporter
MTANRSNWQYLAQEATLILGLSYALWIGGTFSGLIFYRFRLVSLIGLAAVGAVWLLWRWRSGMAGREPLRFPLLALLLAYGLAAAASSDPRRSLIALWQIGLAIWVFWLVSDLLAAGWPTELWVKSLLATGAVVIAVGVLTIGRWYDRWLAIGGFTQPIPPVILRVWTLPGHPNFVAGTLNLLWPLALARLVGRRSRLMRVVLGAWVMGAWFTLFFTSSRGGWLGAVAALIALAVLWITDWGGLAWLRRLGGWLRSRSPFLALLALTVAVVMVGMGIAGWKQLSHPSHGPIMSSRQGYWPIAWQAFLRRPWLGIGPFTFAGEFNRAHSVPPTVIFTHAHSVLFNVLAEAGLIGLLALAGVLVAIIRELMRTWRSAGSGGRVELIGAIAALLSAAVHGLFDTVQMMPTLAMLLAMVAAIGMDGGRTTPGRGWVAPILWAALVAVGGWSLWGYAPAAEGVLAGNLGDWEAAVPLLETAVERDPSLAINQFHAGYARGVLAATDPTQLEPAIAHYRAGIAHDPSYAPHHANLAALLWAAGERDEAIAEMELAQQWAPSAALFPLNLGTYYEAAGDAKTAATAYTRALDLLGGKPAYFWRSTPLRTAVLDDRRAARPPGTDNGWHAFERGDLARARQLFQADLIEFPNSARAYRGLAAVALAEGDQATAKHNLQVALFIGPTYDPREYARAQMDWARLAAAGGDYDQAIKLAAPALDVFRHQSFWGPSRSVGTADYGWYVFYRESFWEEMLPQLVYIKLPDEVGNWMLEVAHWHQRGGEVEAARGLCREILDAIPDNVEAQECLNALDE